ncbi:MAG: endolytic transglycosylase MltG [Gammaproteobacteria bacterium]|nr:endolytic transglycosylase MltG [Gammaproteobacteria bacterium]MYF38608.1 endolytic transglycosylase MltG [Gammaproteobacteria bacterium]
MRPVNRYRAATTLVVLICMVGVVVICHYEMWKHHEIQVESAQTLDIQSGDSFVDIASSLKTMGIIRNVGYFELLARTSGSAASIQAGEYSFSGTYTPVSVLQNLVSGKVVTRTLTLPEGGSFKDLVQVLASAPKLNFDLPNLRVEAALAELGIRRTWAQIPSDHGEGWFFPDTYQYTNTTQASEILITAHNKMIEELRDVWQNRDQSIPFKKPYDMLILASIIEKESGVPQDQQRISGVFCRRLNKGMRLQADPTVIYGLGDTFTGNLTRAHLNMENPYNTYRNFGLPPTPIASPSRAALEAAAHPAPGDALYFVARGDGTSEFSATLEEHNRAVRQYQSNQGN